MAHFETLFTPLVPPKVAPANALEWSNCGLKRIPKDSEQLRLNCESLNARENCFLYVHIRLKRLTNLVSLDMSRNNFTSVPVAIFGLPRLQYLDLSHNKLCSADCNFPAWLNSIRTVILDHNLLVDLPTWWLQAPKMTQLSVNFNTLQPQDENIQERFKVLGSMDSYFPNKSCVQVLHMSNCGLTQLPMWLQALSDPTEIHISNLQQKNSLLNEICYLRQLATRSHFSSNTQVLNLANISLGSLPEDIDHLGSLRVFLLQKNKLSFLPNSFGRLTNLEFCDLSQCKLTDLPQNFGDLVNLKSLILHGNKLCYLPKGMENLINLEYIDLYCNCLDTYPIEVLKISGLRSFDAEMNLFESEIMLTEHDFRSYETKLNCIRSKLSVEDRKMGACVQLNNFESSSAAEDAAGNFASEINHNTQNPAYRPFSLMPSGITSDSSERSSISSQRSLKALACDEEWSSGSELDSEDWDLQRNATKPMKYAWMSPEKMTSWKKLPKLESLTIEDGKFDDCEDSSEGDDI